MFKYFVVSFYLITHYVNASPTTLTIVTEQLPPFQMQSADGVTGYATEIIKAILLEAKIDFKITLYPWTRAYNLAIKKENTCIYSIARTSEREQLFQWTKPIASTNSSFIGLVSNKNIKMTKLEDAKKYITAVIKDDITHQLLLKNGFIEGEHFYVVNNPNSLLKLLTTRKKIDLILVDYLTIKYRAQYDHIDPKIFTPYLHLNKKPLNFYLACSKKTDPIIIDHISESLDNIKAKGVYQKIIDKWLNKEDFLE